MTDLSLRVFDDDLNAGNFNFANTFTCHDIDKDEENTEIALCLAAKKHFSKTGYKSRGGVLSRMDLFVPKNSRENYDPRGKEIVVKFQ